MLFRSDILTIGGIFGKIEGLREKENVVIVKIAKDIKIQISRSAVAEKLDKKVVTF